MTLNNAMPDFKQKLSFLGNKPILLLVIWSDKCLLLVTHLCHPAALLSVCPSSRVAFITDPTIHTVNLQPRPKQQHHPQAAQRHQPTAQDAFRPGHPARNGL